MSVFKQLMEKEPLKYPLRMGNKWDDEEVLKLLTSIKKKKTISDIAKEHERTIGGIESERRKLAADYWFNDNRPIQEISKFTGLTHEQIEETIQRRKNSNRYKKANNILEEPDENLSDMKEIIILLKDIQWKLSIVMEKIF